ncbi:hypothetical protein RND81_14G038400 [Saponaria officinalis]|uniref:EF-hand domain-containing protein n=1 Tax=Saponaria officinalis TaxID=3572 RepID=A0AAW1GL26_SAPOF
MRPHLAKGTNPLMIEFFNMIDTDGDGLINDKEVQSALSSSVSFNNGCSLNTVRLLMFKFSHSSNSRVIGQEEFVALMMSIQSWMKMFGRFDKDRRGSLDSSEFGRALRSLGFNVSPLIVDTLISKFSKSGATSLPFDSFIEIDMLIYLVLFLSCRCCLIATELIESFNKTTDDGTTSDGTTSGGSMDLGRALKKNGVICNFLMG